MTDKRHQQANTGTPTRINLVEELIGKISPATRFLFTVLIFAAGIFAILMLDTSYLHQMVLESHKNSIISLFISIGNDNQLLNQYAVVLLTMLCLTVYLASKLLKAIHRAIKKWSDLSA